MTGFCVQADAGSALLGAVGVLLQHFGFSVWDLGKNNVFNVMMYRYEHGVQGADGRVTHSSFRVPSADDDADRD